MDKNPVADSGYLSFLHDFFNHIFWLFFDAQGRFVLWISAVVLLVAIVAVRVALDVRKERRAVRRTELQ